MPRQLLQRPHTWEPSTRDQAEQDICRRILADPAWAAWCDTLTDIEYDDYIAFLLVQMGINNKLDSYAQKRRSEQSKHKCKNTP